MSFDSSAVACHDVWQVIAEYLPADEVDELSNFDTNLGQALESVYVDHPMRNRSFVDPQACCRPWRRGNGWGTFAWILEPRRLVSALVELELKEDVSARSDATRLVMFSYSSFRLSFHIGLGRNYRHLLWSHWVIGKNQGRGVQQLALPPEDEKVAHIIDAQLRTELPRGDVHPEYIVLTHWCQETTHLLEYLASRGAVQKQPDGRGYCVYSFPN